MTNVLVTGANGFVGRHLCEALATRGHQVVGTARDRAHESMDSSYELRAIADIGEDVDWSPVLRGMDVVVHLAARVHVMRDQVNDPLAEFRRVNLHGSERLASCAMAVGVKRLIYISTIKVLGEMTDGQAFNNRDIAAPRDPYAISKWEAEEALGKLAKNGKLEIVVLRPPLIYGPEVGGNFLRVLNLISREIPLPLGMIRNMRSMLGVSNFCDVIQICLEHPDAAGRCFLVADGEDVSTPELFQIISNLMGRPSRLFPVPEGLLRCAGKILRRSNEIDRLCESLQIDIQNTTRVLDWLPQTSLEGGLRSVVQWYMQGEHRRHA